MEYPILGRAQVSAFHDPNDVALQLQYVRPSKTGCAKRLTVVQKSTLLSATGFSCDRKQRYSLIQDRALYHAHWIELLMSLLPC